MRCLTLSVIRLNPRGVKKRKKKRKKSVESLLRDSHFLLVPMDTAVKYGPCLLALQKKRIKFFETKCMRKLLRISYLEHKTSDWVRARSASLWVHRNLFWQLSRDGNLQGPGMSHVTTASPKPSLRAPWRMGDAVVRRGNAGWTASKSGHPCPY